MSIFKIEASTDIFTLLMQPSISLLCYSFPNKQNFSIIIFYVSGVCTIKSNSTE